MLSHKTNLNKFKRAEIKQRLFSDYSGIKLESNNRMKTGKSQNMWRLNNTPLNKKWT